MFRIIATAFCCLLLAVPATVWAQRATVKTTDGREFTGELISEGRDQIIIVIAGIRTPIDRDQIKSIERERGLAEEYQERREALAEDDLEGRFDLARWLFDERDALELAQKELDALKDDVDSDKKPALAEKVRVMSAVVANRLKIQQEAEAEADRRDQDADQTPEDPVDPDPTDTDPEDTGSQTSETVRKDPGERLTEKQEKELMENRVTEKMINRIRVYEMDADLQTPVQIDGDIERELLDKYASNDDVPKGRSAQRRWLALPDNEKLELFYAVQAREYYSDINVRRDPPAMQNFRQIHRTYVVNYCATDACHGGTGAGDLLLYNRRINDDRTYYSNFIILDKYGTSGGVMIDRQEPARSLLLQYGIPRKLAGVPHPDVPGWRPRLLSDDHPQYRSIRQWIGEELYSPPPDYGINWRVPKPIVAAEPADNPTE
ncbi:MAG: hypothetical protein R3336_01205 [Phycisphaeraceae bacterium]|nr:hypothetical protein [Phycisphaeraceae bacterium]